MTLPQTVRIREIRDETRTVRTFVLDAEVPEAEPGQFIMLWLPGVDEKPISIAHPAPLTLTVARVGPFSTALHGRKVGDRVGWRGPYGRGFSLRQDQPALLVAGGYGVAPLYFLATRAVARSVPTAVALGARTALDLLYVEQCSFIGLITCAVMAGELAADCTQDEENFPDIPNAAKLPLALVFLAFAALEANKVRSRLTRARGFR